METLEFERQGRVGWLRLNRPEKLNAMNALLWRELAELGPRLRDDPDLRADVVIGNGRAFSAGIDLGLDPGAAGDRPAVLTERTEEREEAIAAIQEGYSGLHEAWYSAIAAGWG